MEIKSIMVITRNSYYLFLKIIFLRFSDNLIGGIFHKEDYEILRNAYFKMRSLFKVHFSLKDYYLFQFFFILIIGLTTGFAQKTSVYVSAHPDDWQLFMNPNAYLSIKEDNKVVFIHPTSGDGGNGIRSDFYLAREEGSIRSLRFLANTLSLGEGIGKSEMIIIEGHTIKKITYKNIVSYFLRLPDGNINGSGYSNTSNQSLEKLFKNEISEISAIDGSTSYVSLADLQETLEAIVVLESDPARTIEFHITDSDISSNPSDHSDHIYSSLIVEKAAISIGRGAINYYQGYIIDSKPQNIFGYELLINAGTWGVTTSTLGEYSYNSTWDQLHNNWIDKQYYRSVLIVNNDKDSDGVLDSIDLDDDNDGILDTVEDNVVANRDTDGDGIPDRLELDADNDGCFDVVEAGFTDGDGDGRLGSAPITVDAQGRVTSGTNGYTAPADLNANGTPDFQEAGAVPAITTQPSNQNLIPNASATFTVVASADTYQWQVSTDAGASWVNLANGGDYAGVTASTLTVTNTDLSKVSYRYRLVVSNSAFACDSTTTSTSAGYITPGDTDSDGLPDIVDLDDDNDGILDTAEDNGVANRDTDGDGIPDRLELDADNDGCFDVVEAGFTDGDGDGRLGSAPVTVDAQGRVTSGTNGYTAPADLNANGTPDFQEAGVAAAITTQPLNQNFVIGNVIFTVAASANYYQWQVSQDIGVSWSNLVDGADYSGSGTPSLTVTNANLSKLNYQYRVQVKNLDFNCSSISTSNPAKFISPNLVNLALNKPTSSSSSEGNNLSSKAVDGINSTSSWWGANPYSQWWRVDLQNIYSLSKIVVTNYYDGKRYYKYDIEASIDGTNWVKIVDFNNNTSPATSAGNVFYINNYNARYLRVNMNFNSANTGVHIVEFEAYGDVGTVEVPPIPQNIALNKPTSSSRSEGNNVSSLAVDGINSDSNYWGASPYSQWWRVDLQNVYSVNRINVTNYYDGIRYYKYDIEASVDGSNWVKIIDFNNNILPATIEGNSFNVNNIKARYLRVNMNFNSANVGVHIVEFEAYGEIDNTANKEDLNLNKEFLSNENLFSVYPNPPNLNDEINLVINRPANSVIELLVHDSSGKLIIFENHKITSNATNIKINKANLPIGLVIFTVISGDIKESKKVLVN